MPFSLDKSCRIRRSSDYKRAYDEGAKVSGKFILAVIRPSEGPLRVGITVSRKVGSACVRNLVKRRIREAVRQELDPALSGWDVVLIARGQVGQKGQVRSSGLNELRQKKGSGGAIRLKSVSKSGGVKETTPIFSLFSEIIKDIRRIAGRLSKVEGERPVNVIKGKG